MTDKNKKHLNFDLDFLESVKTETPDPATKKETEGPVTVNVTTNKPENQQSKSKNNSCLIAAIIIGVIIFFVWIGSSDSNSSTTPSSCDTSKLQSLKPPDSDKNKIESLKRSIDSSSVNQYSSQYLIDQYNAKVDEYNNLRNSYNSKTDIYNAYLTTNCKN